MAVKLGLGNEERGEEKLGLGNEEEKRR